MKARIKFSKTGSMRFIGHLDVMRYFQKAFRRAGIKVSYSQGFSPHQLMSFTSPLGIGLSSDAEYLDITLDETDEPDVMLEKINGAMNSEIKVKAFTLLEDEAKPSMAMLAACDYLVAVKPGKDNAFTDSAFRKEVIDRLMKKSAIEIVKKTKKSEKLVDIKENIYVISDNMEEFAELTGNTYGELCVNPECIPVMYCQLTAGSVINIKPELVMESLCTEAGVEFNPLDYQIHRLEMYGDADGKKGEIHTKTSEIPCRLVPMSEYDKKGQQS